jgi:hypothetical protein
MNDIELKEWGFSLLAEIPTKKGTMTMYKANLHHSAFVSDSVNFRWSHSFAFSHEEPKEMFFKDLIK